MAVVRQLQVNWQLKAATFNVLDRLPGGYSLYYFLQRHVTRSIPRKLAPTASVAQHSLMHAAALRNSGGELATARIFEFGAGWDLYNSLVLYCMGANHQWTIDIQRLARADAINSVINHLAIDPPAGAIRKPSALVTANTLEDDLARLYGIHYVAPMDARRLSIDDESIDFICTTSVLEHVPEDILKGIMPECRRILKRTGFMSHVVDFSDHYSHTDKSIGNFNYLQFSDDQWRKFNPGIHYQNRMRRKDYDSIFRNAGCAVVSSAPWYEDPNVKIDVRIDDKFRKHSENELRELGCHFILQRDDASSSAS